MTPSGKPMITRPSELDHEKTLNQARQFIEIMGGDIGRAKDAIRQSMEYKRAAHDLDGYLEVTRIGLAIVEIERGDQPATAT